MKAYEKVSADDEEDPHGPGCTDVGARRPSADEERREGGAGTGPHPPHVGLSLLPLPLLALWGYGAYAFAGRLWSVAPFSFHAQCCLFLVGRRVAAGFPRRRCRGAAVDVFLFGLVYPLVAYGLTVFFFWDVDGTIVADWSGTVAYLGTLTCFGWAVAVVRVFEFCCSAPVRTRKLKGQTAFRCDSSGDHSETTSNVLPRILRFATLLTLALNLLCVASALTHLGPPFGDGSLAPRSKNCDPLDTTECSFPFPSFHHMEPDPASPTGWRVHLQGLPPLRGGHPLRHAFWNEMDGFSTMAPIMFYLEGLKEAHERGTGDGPRLQGPERIGRSVTDASITLLLDVRRGILVHHSAEVDYLDPEHPSILLVPAQPLRHRTHYAVAVLDATDAGGLPLPRTDGMRDLLQGAESARKARYVREVVPALRRAAPWVSSEGDVPGSVQLLFDFVTISEDSQVGTVRSVRDASLRHVQDWTWTDHVEILSSTRHDCADVNSSIARTLHLSLDAPSFLERRSRYSLLDRLAIESGTPVTIEKVKAMILIPCSVERAIFVEADENPLQAVVEYGHGLFNSRKEVTDGYLTELANENGYVLMAADWRGMSLFDLPVVIKTLIGSPSLFEATRDNLIQGFSDKLVLRHFSRHGLLHLLRTAGTPLPVDDGRPPPSVFYGISQGGILGAGYLALAGPRGLVDRGILGSMGTPFALVLTRSADFAGFDALLRSNFYTGRHVRLFVTLCQMGWDSVEASGLLAPPVAEPRPRMLFQAGLGDAIVPTGAAEALVRAAGGYALPHNPRAVFGIPVGEAANVTSMGPDVTFTEVLYEKEFNGLPADNIVPSSVSVNVHYCLRKDREMIRQMVEFINTGRVIDPCIEDGCRRKYADCFG